MGGKAKPPKQTDEQLKNEKLTNELLKQQLEDAKKPVVIPDIKIPAPVVTPPPPPPISGSTSDQFQAAQDAKKKAYGRTNSGRGTLFAGETGGYKAPTKTLLG